MNIRVCMEQMTWDEIRDAVRAGKTTAILVSGAMEQHGPHLPVATDTLLGYAVAVKAAEILGNALVAPIVYPGLSEHHMGFPGSFTLTWDTYLEILEAFCEGLAESGFRDIVLTSSHGGNVAVLKVLTPRIAKKMGSRTRVNMVDYLRASSGAVEDYLKNAGISKTRAGVHSGYAETAMMLAVEPDLVEMDAVEEGLVDDAFYHADHIARSQIDTFIHGVHHFIPNGILGDPRGAEAEQGRRLMEITVRSFVGGIRNILRS